jgi:hypothetical protein
MFVIRPLSSKSRQLASREMMSTKSTLLTSKSIWPSYLYIISTSSETASGEPHRYIMLGLTDLRAIPFFISILHVALQRRASEYVESTGRSYMIKDICLASGEWQAYSSHHRDFILSELLHYTMLPRLVGCYFSCYHRRMVHLAVRLQSICILSIEYHAS